MSDADRTYPVIETFGPTIQGEGALAGLTTHFVRFGGCDYRCSWCDSMYAVDPIEVKQNAFAKSTQDLVDDLIDLGLRKGGWVTLSGGNPAMLKLGPFVDFLQAAGQRVAVETQGSLWKEWLGRVDMLTVSPKPPSSGMVSDGHAVQTQRFMSLASEAADAIHRCLKIVVFDETDYEWARGMIEFYPDWAPFLSVGTDQPDSKIANLTYTHDSSLVAIGERYRWLCERVANDPVLQAARVLPQLHVLAWGHAKGV